MHGLAQAAAGGQREDAGAPGAAGDGAEALVEPGAVDQGGAQHGPRRAVAGAGGGQRLFAVAQLLRDRAFGRYAGVALGFRAHRAGGDDAWRLAAEVGARQPFGERTQRAEADDGDGRRQFRRHGVGQFALQPAQAGLRRACAAAQRDHGGAAGEQARQQEVADLAAAAEYQDGHALVRNPIAGARRGRARAAGSAPACAPVPATVRRRCGCPGRAGGRLRPARRRRGAGA